MGARIPILDLAAEWAEVGADVEAAVLRVLRSGQYILGPETTAFEHAIADLAGTRHCIGVGSGTEALWLTLVALGIGPGDEVVTTPFTYFATVEAILWTGATPVFADVERASFNLDPARAEAAIGPRTKAILPVHLFGRCADVTRLGAIAARRGVPVIEDAAQAIGAARGGRRAGALGLAGCFSFYPSKNLGAAGDGGCVTTDDDGLAETLRLLRAHGSPQRDVHERLGTSSRLDSLQAAILRAKLPRLAGWAAARAERATRYTERLSGCRGVVVPGAGRDEVHVWNQFTIRCKDAARVRAALDAEGVEWRHYYPTPAWEQPALAGRGRLAAPCPESLAACREALSLPVYPQLPLEAVDRIAGVVRAAAAE